MVDLKKLSETELAERLSASLDLLTDSKQKSEMQYLAHNLQTHQIELEMQNRELRETQNKLEVSRNRYADLYDFAPVGYLTLDTKGIITEINLTGARMLGLERGNVINQPMTRWLEPESRTAFLNHLRLVFDKKGKAVAELKIRGQGYGATKNVQFESTAAPVDESQSFCHTAMIDVSERKQHEAQLVLARDAARAADEAKMQFLSRMSHEFRTPLNAVLGFAQLVEMNLSEHLDDKTLPMIQQVIKSGGYMLELVNDLLDLAAIEANKIELHVEPVNMMVRIQDSMDLMQALAQQHEISMHSSNDLAEDIYVQADPLRLKQVLLNLLSNAVKYNHTGGSITLSLQRAGTTAVRVNITDTGTGIAAEDIPILFEPFSRLYLRTYAIEGTGIGLTIAKQMIERMGGRIGVTSQLGQGSTFWFELPIVQPPA